MPSRRRALFSLAVSLASPWGRRSHARQGGAMTHIALLGDSVFDNAAYTGGQPAVRDHLRSMLPRGSKATLCAVDGARIADLAAQLERVPVEATHLVISVGGNDALANRDLLATRVASTTEALDMFAERAASFESAYRSALARAIASGKPLTSCTIYNGNLDASEARVARIALVIFNDAILRVAFELGIDVVDLRLVCPEPGDYANAIEPSGSGGDKIARAILNACSVGKPGLRSSRVFQS
jgi:hypothetical protein